MALILTDERHYADIADAIREKTGNEDGLYPSEMPDAIRGIVGGSDPELQDKTVTPSTSTQVVTPDAGMDGLSSVTVGAVTSTIDSNIRPEYIKRGMTILSVAGSYAGEVESFNGRTGSITPQTGDYTPEMVGAIATSSKGAANGVASLNNDSKIPVSQLPISVSGETLVIG